MPIDFLCPGCQRRYSVAERFAGATVKCKNCNETMLVPRVEEEPVSAAYDDELGLAPLDDDPPKQQPQPKSPSNVQPSSMGQSPAISQASLPPIRTSQSNGSGAAGTAATVAAKPAAVPAVRQPQGVALNAGALGASQLGNSGAALQSPIEASLTETSSGALPKGAWIAIGLAATIAVSVILTLVVIRSGKSDDPTLAAAGSGDSSNAHSEINGPEKVVAKNSSTNSPGNQSRSDINAEVVKKPDRRMPATKNDQPPPNTNPVSLPAIVERGLRPIERNKPDLNLVAWTVQPDPAPEATVASKSKWAEVSIPVADSNRIVFFSTRLGPFMGVFGGSGRDARCGTVDLRDGKKRGPFPTDVAATKTFKLSADGKFVAARVGHVHDNLVHIWSMETGVMTQRLKPSPKADIPWFDFARDNEVVTYSFEGDNAVLTVWNVIDGKPLRQIAVTRKQHDRHEYDGAAISPTGKYLAMGLENAVQVFDLTEGKCVGEASFPQVGNNSSPDVNGLAFSNNAGELAAVITDHNITQLAVWDAKTGKLDRTTDLKTDQAHHRYAGPRLEWLPDDSGWLIDGRAIYSRQAAETPIFEFPNQDGFNIDRRKVLDLTTAVIVEGDQFKRNSILKTVKLPGELLAKRIATMRAGGDLLDAELPPLTNSVVTGLRTVDVNARPSGWKYEARSIGAPLASGKTQITMSDVRWSVSRMIAASPASGKLIIDKKDLSSANSPARMLERYDLASRKADGAVSVHADAALMDISADGSLAIFVSGKRFPRVDILSLTTKAPVIGWRPLKDLPAAPAPTVRNIAADESQFNPDTAIIKTASIVDDQHVVTGDSTGRIVGWKLPECQAIYLRTNQERLLAMSPCRRYFAVTNLQPDGGLQIVDAKSGETVGLIPFTVIELIGNPSVAFRPDGAALAVVQRFADHVKLTRCDLAAGKRDLEVVLPPMSSAQSLIWCDPSFLLCDKALIDLDRRAVVWQYTFQANGSWPDVLGMRTWLAMQSPDGRSRQLTAVTIPSDRVRQALANVMPVQPLLGPGTKISVAANVSVPNVNQEPILALMKRRFEQQGYAIDDAAPVRVTLNAHERTTGNKINIR